MKCQYFGCWGHGSARPGRSDELGNGAQTTLGLNCSKHKKELVLGMVDFHGPSSINCVSLVSFLPHTVSPTAGKVAKSDSLVIYSASYSGVELAAAVIHYVRVLFEL
jgi:hypothetical protein